MKIFALLMCLIVFTATMCSGCKAHNKQSGITPTPFVQTEENLPTPTPFIPEYPVLYSALEEGFNDKLVIINNYTMPLGYSNAEKTILTRNRYVIKAGLIKEFLPKALEQVKSAAITDYSDRTVEFSSNIEYPNWQYLSATLPYAADEQYLLYNIMRIQIQVDLSINNLAVVTVTNSLPTIHEFAKDRANEVAPDKQANTYLDIRFNYAYMKAVYDDEGNEHLTPREYGFDADYINTLKFPLSTVPTFRDTWEQGRSNNTRKHMGTDIKNPEGEELHSCNAGQVLYIGTSSIPGNYIIIMDDYGFEYHYYHLVELPTEVKVGDRITQGQLIGHIGNTGNSDASHLHLSIIEPEGAFVNPYNLLVELSESVPNQ